MMLNEQVSPSLCGAFHCSGDNVYIYSQSVNKGKNTIWPALVLGRSVTKYPRTVWNVQSLQQTRSRWLDR